MKDNLGFLENTLSESQWGLLQKKAMSITKEEWSVYHSKKVIESLYGKYGIVDIEVAEREYGAIINQVSIENAIDLLNVSELGDLFYQLIIDNNMIKPTDNVSASHVSELKMIQHVVDNNVIEHNIYKPEDNKKGWYFLYFISVNKNDKIEFWDKKKVYSLKNNHLLLIPTHTSHDYIIRVHKKDNAIYYIKGFISYDSN